MNLIAGTVALTSAFLVATSVLGHWVGRQPLPGNDGDDAIADRAMFKRARTLMVAILVGYFVGMANLLVSAGLLTIAAINLVVGTSAIVILWDASSDRRPGAER